MKLSIGKLDSDILQKTVLDNIKYKNDCVKIRAGIGEDCAVVDFGQYDCIVSTDPITASVKDIGRLAIHISCNDIASNGIRPVGITLVLMLPEGTTSEEVDTIMSQAGKAASEAKVEIVGGHTEVTNAVNQPVVVSTAFGKVLSQEPQTAALMQPGDAVIMTKSAGIEGTGIIVTDYEEELKGYLTEAEIAEGKKLLEQVSVIEEGVIAGEIGTRGMHDITEGGVLGAVWEMCHISGLGVLLEEKDITVNSVTKKVADKYDIDCLRLISSGSMIIVSAKEKEDEILNALKEANIEASIIGRIKEADCGLKINCADGEVKEITPPERDELYKVVK